MYNNLYSMPGAYNNQENIDRINNQIMQLESMKKQLQQPPVQQPTNLTQNFQLAPNRDVIRYANNMEEVNRDIVNGDTPYFSRDMSIVWIKNINGDIKTYELNEIVPKDEKDMKIDFLIAQIEQLKKEMKSNESNADVIRTVAEPVEGEKSSSIPTISKSTKKTK